MASTSDLICPRFKVATVRYWGKRQMPPCGLLIERPIPPLMPSISRPALNVIVWDCERQIIWSPEAYVVLLDLLEAHITSRRIWIIPTDDWSLRDARSQRAEPLQFIPNAEMIGSHCVRKSRTTLSPLWSILASLSRIPAFEDSGKEFFRWGRRKIDFEYLR